MNFIPSAGSVTLGYSEKKKIQIAQVTAAEANVGILPFLIYLLFFCNIRLKERQEQ